MCVCVCVCVCVRARVCVFVYYVYMYMYTSELIFLECTAYIRRNQTKYVHFHTLV